MGSLYITAWLWWAGDALSRDGSTAVNSNYRMAGRRKLVWGKNRIHNPRLGKIKSKVLGLLNYQPIKVRSSPIKQKWAIGGKFFIGLSVPFNYIENMVNRIKNYRNTHTYVDSFTFSFNHLRYILVSCPGVKFLQVKGCFWLPSYTTLSSCPIFSQDRSCVWAKITPGLVSQYTFPLCPHVYILVP